MKRGMGMEEKISTGEAEGLCIHCNEIFSVTTDPSQGISVEMECPYCEYFHQTTLAADKRHRSRYSREIK